MWNVFTAYYGYALCRRLLTRRRLWRECSFRRYSAVGHPFGKGRQISAVLDIPKLSFGIPASTQLLGFVFFGKGDFQVGSHDQMSLMTFLPGRLE